MHATMDIPDLVEPVEATLVADDGLDAPVSTLGLVEMLLKDRARLDRMLRCPPRQAELVTGLLTVSLVGLTVFGVAMTIIMNLTHLAPPLLPAVAWDRLSSVNLTLAYNLGIVAATCVCLPSFYFYGLLAGLPLTMLEVTAHAVRGMAATVTALVGILPIYVAWALGVLLFVPSLVEPAVYIGLILPFGAGFWGLFVLYRGFLGMASVRSCERGSVRVCFVRRMTLAWSACYTVVTPVMIYWLWNLLSRTTVDA